MDTYISLISWTQKGLESIKDSPARLDAAKKAFKAAGAELKQFYMLSGRYDLLVISEAPDYDTVARVSLIIGSAGSIRTETMRAFTEEQYRKIVGSLP